MAIYRTFPGMKGLTGKSVDAAYRERERKKKTSGGNSTEDSQSESSDPEKTSCDGQATLHTFLVQLRQDVEHWVHD